MSNLQALRYLLLLGLTLPACTEKCSEREESHFPPMGRGDFEQEQFKEKSPDEMPAGLARCNHLKEVGDRTFQADATGDGQMEQWSWEPAGAHSLYLTISREDGEELGVWFSSGGFSCAHIEDGFPLVAIRNRDMDDPINSDQVSLFRFNSSITSDPWELVCDPFRSDHDFWIQPGNDPPRESSRFLGGGDGLR